MLFFWTLFMYIAPFTVWKKILYYVHSAWKVAIMQITIYVYMLNMFLDTINIISTSILNTRYDYLNIVLKRKCLRFEHYKIDWLFMLFKPLAYWNLFNLVQQVLKHIFHKLNVTFFKGRSFSTNVFVRQSHRYTITLSVFTIYYP